MNRKIITIACSCFLWCNAAIAQTVSLKGIVTFQNSGNKPVLGAQIKSLWATPKLTDNKGQFRLDLVQKLAGDEIDLSVTYNGYEVVNKKELTLNINPEIAIKYYLCKIGHWEKSAFSFYQINEAVVLKEHNNKIKGLKLVNERFRDSIEALEKQKNNALKQVRELSELFAKANLDDASELFNKAFIEFKNGRIDASLKVLSLDTLNAKIKSAIQKKNEGNKLIEIGRQKVETSEKAIQDYISLSITAAKMASSSFKFSNAKRYYQLALGYDSTNTHNLEEYADFLINQNDPDAQRITWRAIGIRDNERKNILKHATLTDSLFEELHFATYRQAALLLKIREFDSTKNLYTNLFYAYAQLSQPTLASMRYIASNYSTLAMLFMANEDFFAKTLNEDNQTKLRNQASQYLSKAWVIIDSLSRIDTISYDTYKVTILSYAAFHSLISGYQAEAIKYYKRVLDLRQKSNTPKSNEYLDDNANYYNQIALAFMKLGSSYDKREYYDSALVYVSKSLEIRRGNVKRDSATYKLDLLSDLALMGGLYVDMNDDERATNIRYELLREYKNLAQLNHNRFTPDLAQQYIDLGEFYTDKKVDDSAKKYYELAIGIYSNLNYHSSLARAQTSYASIFKKDGKLREAKDLFKKALDNQRYIVANQDSSVYEKRTLALCYNNLASTYRMEKKYDSAINLYLLSDQIYKSMVPENPKLWRRYVGEISNVISENYSEMAHSEKDSSVKVTAYRNSILFLHKAFDIDSNYRRFTKIGLAHFVLSHYEKNPFTDLDKAITYIKDAMRVDTSELARNLLFSSYIRACDLNLDSCSLDKAETYALQAVNYFSLGKVRAYLALTARIKNMEDYGEHLEKWQANAKEKADAMSQLINRLSQKSCMTEQQIANIKRDLLKL